MNANTPITLPFTSFSTGGQNGRVNLTPAASAGGAIDSFPAYTHQIAVENNFEDDMLRGNWESNPLTKAFFSPTNIKTIQNSIRKEVFNQSKPKGYVIDEQSVDELKIIMRGMYYQYARNLPTGISEQVNDLNKKVLDWSVPHILSAVDHYYYYLNDISHLPVPMQQPQSMSSAGSKSLPLNPYM
jgi:Family of unknown function (DUF5761)